ncbi:MAG: phosphoribosylformylglycinamidine synthase subunit PurL [Dehalococcoidia bacterium]
MLRIEVWNKPDFPDPRAEGLKKDIADLGIGGIEHIDISDLYFLSGDLDSNDAARICREVLVDPIVQDCRFEMTSAGSGERKDGFSIEVAYNAGVMDPIEHSLRKAVADLGIEKVSAIKTGKRYVLTGSLSEENLQSIVNKLLLNPVVQHVVTRSERIDLAPAEYNFELVTVNLLDAGEQELERIGSHKLSLNLGEMEKIQQFFSSLGRNPTDVELETLGQTWSEHCVHKTFTGRIVLGDEVVDNLLKSTISKATRELDLPWCLSVFVDNAGVIDFDGSNALCFKVETHNHPSAIEPYGGASTGIGGVIRDPLGTGLGAKPILNTDVFCFGTPDYPYEKLPAGTLHPRRIFKGVRAGVADYGNRMGIPTSNGAILFDDRYVGNPLVYCGTLGIMPATMAKPGRQMPGDKVVLLGGKTGRDGIHGVTFASVELTRESEDTSASSVQIGDPITEKKLVDTILKARDQGLYRRITDCGGGGLSSAVGEMAEETGVKVYLEKVPLKYAGLSYTEIWISEAQERMILAVPPEKLSRLLDLCAAENTEASVIGEFTDTKRLELFYEGKQVCDLEMDFLHNGTPQVEREAIWDQPQHPEPDFAEPEDLSRDLLDLLGAWNICSKEWVIRQYDHEVQGGSILKPLVGVDEDGPGDATIIKPVLGSNKGAVVSNGINPKYGDIDPYWMAASAIDEALRQIIAVGGSLKRAALLDNFSWGNPTRPDRLGALVRAAQACYDLSLAYGAPFISGKDSLFNEYEVEGETICIPHTLLISAIAVMDDVNKAVSMDLKEAGNLIYIVGETFNELGGSHYFGKCGFIGNAVPRVDAVKGRKNMEALSFATQQGLVAACHDCSEGGIGVAAAEMAFAGGLGMKIELKKVPLGEPINRNDYILFSESNSRFLVEVKQEMRGAFEKTLAGVDFALIGEVNDSKILEVSGIDGHKIISAGIDELKEAWQKPLRW